MQRLTDPSPHRFSKPTHQLKHPHCQRFVRCVVWIPQIVSTLADFSGAFSKKIQRATTRSSGSLTNRPSAECLGRHAGHTPSLPRKRTRWRTSDACCGPMVSSLVSEALCTTQRRRLTARPSGCARFANGLVQRWTAQQTTALEHFICFAPTSPVTRSVSSAKIATRLTVAVSPNPSCTATCTQPIVSRNL